MSKWVAWIAAVAVVPLLAGCFGSDSDDNGADGPVDVTYPYYDPQDGLYHYKVDADGFGSMFVNWAPGAVSTAWTDGGVGYMEFDGNTVLVLEGAAWTLASQPQYSVGPDSNFT